MADATAWRQWEQGFAAVVKDHGAPGAGDLLLSTDHDFGDKRT